MTTAGTHGQDVPARRQVSAFAKLKAASPLRRHHVAAARMCAERHLLAAAKSPASARRPRVLAYHAVGTPHWGVSDVAPDRFRLQLEWAFEHGYRFVPARDIADGRGAPGDLAITFDDGVRSVKTVAMPILRALNIPWTMFVVTGWADGEAGSWAGDMLLDWSDLEEMLAAGASIGSHSVTHRNLALVSADELCFELEDSRRLIQRRLGVPADEFAIPMGQSKDWNAAAARAAAEAGYVNVYAQTESRRFPGTVPRTFITRWDSLRIFRAALTGKFDAWEEWY